MSTTLTNGLKLPDKGSVDWYADMQSNYAILDGAVGTVAEHASQIAGKAPLVHTHTKSDVTDLFNSANTWTGDNTYTKYQNIVIDGTEIGVAPTSQNRNGLLFKDKNGVNIGWLKHQYDTSGDISIEMLVSNKYKNGALDPTGTQAYQGVRQVLTSNGVSYFNWSGYVNNSLYPYTTETFNIGDSTHQWNNLYAKNYFYNGTAWGLDKANTWTGNNTFTGRTSYIGIYDKFQTASFDVRTDPESTRGGDVFRFWSGTGATYGDYLGGMSFYQSTDGSLTLQLICFGYPQTGNSTQNRINFRSARDGTSDFYPVKNNNINLGTSTNKWKSFNGVNPGALSLPDYAHPTSLDVSAQGLNWHTDATPNFYEVPANGYFAVIVQCPTVSNGVLDIFVNNTGIGSSDHGTYAGNELFCYVPVIQGQTVRVRARCDNYYSVTFYPCLGNV